MKTTIGCWCRQREVSKTMSIATIKGSSKSGSPRDNDRPCVCERQPPATQPDTTAVASPSRGRCRSIGTANSVVGAGDGDVGTGGWSGGEHEQITIPDY